MHRSEIHRGALMRVMSVDINLRSPMESKVPRVRLQPYSTVRSLSDHISVLHLFGTAMGCEGLKIHAHARSLTSGYGIYAYVQETPGTDTIYIGTDPMGFTPLYYAYENNVLKISTSISDLKSRVDSLTPNYEAWEEIFTLGDLLGSKTPIEEITRLPSGHRLTIQNGVVELESIWSPEPVELTGLDGFPEKANAKPSIDERRTKASPGGCGPPEAQQITACRLLCISRGCLYYTPKGESDFNLALMRQIDEQYLKTPWYGSRQMVRHLKRAGLLLAANAFDG